MNVPKELKYTEEHEWVRIEDDGTATIGVTDYAQEELGELVYIEVDTVGDELDKDDVFGTAEAVKTTSELFMPLDGEVLEFNEDLDEDEGDNPGLVNEDPYGDGWIVKIKVTDEDQLDDLMNADDYEKHIS